MKNELNLTPEILHARHLLGRRDFLQVGMMSGLGLSLPNLLRMEARAAAQNIISDIYAMFVDLVTERRKMERNTVLEIADGRVYTGRQALNNGLIDAVGDMETARQWLADSRDIAKSLPLRPLIIKRDRDSLLERISDLFGITLFSERLRLDGVISLWQPALR